VVLGEQVAAFLADEQQQWQQQKQQQQHNCTAGTMHWASATGHTSDLSIPRDS
jgi:hypothetical protein